MSTPDLSILIVHYNTPRLLRQTLKGLFRLKPSVCFEVIVVDNNPAARLPDALRQEFPRVKFLTSTRNVGFGGGMNFAMEHARGRYWFVFNPDIAVFDGAFEELVRFMDAHPQVGVLGPKLCHPDRSLQHSCYTFAPPSTILYRRLPLLHRFAFARKAVREYLLADWDHGQTREVDYLLGAALLVRREAVREVGGFDPKLYMYFEDQDWCRRFWMAGWKVVYHPAAFLVHYHRRETAEGGFLRQFLNPLTRVQLRSAWYYYKKYRRQINPRTAKSV